MTLVAVAAVAVLLSGLLSACGTLDKDDLRTAVQQIHSDAAEGVLLAEQAEKRAVPTQFVWLQSQELRHVAVQVRDKLEGEIQAYEVQPHVPEARAVIDKVVAALHLLHEFPGNRADAQAVWAALAHESETSERLADELS